MERKDRIDLAGAAMLVGISLLLGLNQVLVKVVNGGIAPAMQAGLRSAIALLPVLAIAWISRRQLFARDGTLPWGLLSGTCFGLEFLLLFIALDHSTVGRVSVLFYTMPVWLTLAAHLLIPGERLTPRRIAGLVLAVAGVAVAMGDRMGGQATLLGDVLCLAAAMLWAAIGLIARLTPLARVSAEKQLVYQLVVSAALLIPLALAMGTPWREPTALHWGILAFQAVFVACGAFLLWFWVLKVYPASDMASFSFLAPVFGVLLGWLILGEPLSASVLVALVLVSAGIVLINRRPRVVTA